MTSGTCVLGTIISECCWGETSSGFLHFCAQAPKPPRACLLSAVIVDLCSKATIYDVFYGWESSFYWFLVLSQPCAAYIWRLIEEAFKRGGQIKLCVHHQCLLYWASLSITCQTLLAWRQRLIVRPMVWICFYAAEILLWHQRMTAI